MSRLQAYHPEVTHISPSIENVSQPTLDSRINYSPVHLSFNFQIILLKSHLSFICTCNNYLQVLKQFGSKFNFHQQDQLHVHKQVIHCFMFVGMMQVKQCIWHKEVVLGAFHKLRLQVVRKTCRLLHKKCKLGAYMVKKFQKVQT